MAQASDAQQLVELRVKFVHGDGADVLVTAAPEEMMDSVSQKICEAKGVPQGKHLRILCAGKELFADDPVSRASARVLHCMLTDTPPQRPPPVVEQPKVAPPPPPPPVVEQPPLDWLDVVDPGTVLMWIFGSILALLWLLFVFYAHMFDRTSVVMLIMMTVAFLIPCVLSYLPCPAFLQPQPQPPRPPHGSVYDPVTGRSTAVAPNGAVQRSPHLYAGDVPPRPPARGRPAS